MSVTDTVDVLHYLLIGVELAALDLSRNNGSLY